MYEPIPNNHAKVAREALSLRTREESKQKKLFNKLELWLTKCKLINEYQPHTYTTHHTKHTHITHTPHTHATHHTHTTHITCTHHTHTHTYTPHTENRGGIIWYGITLTKSTITGIRGKEACVASTSTEGSAYLYDTSPPEVGIQPECR